MEYLLREILSEVKTTKEDISFLKSEVSSIKSDVSTLQSDMSLLKSDVGTLQSDMISVKDKLDNVSKQTAYNTEMLLSLQNEMATKEDIRFIDARLDYQLGRIAKTEESLSLLRQQ